MRYTPVCKQAADNADGVTYDRLQFGAPQPEREYNILSAHARKIMPTPHPFSPEDARAVNHID